MMHNDSAAILDDLLSRWHSWSKAAGINGTDRLDDPTFRDARTSRSHQTTSEILDDESHNLRMRAVDFAVTGDRKGQGAMEDPYRTAICFQARNLCTGRKVWLSNRLPKDPQELGVILGEARGILIRRLRHAGVM